MAYRWITAQELATALSTSPEGLRVVDVRDQDFDGGNIVGAINAPSEQRTEQSVQDLVQQLKDVPRVVFHCALSQVRGPKAARIYAEELERQQSVAAYDKMVEDAKTAPPSGNSAASFSPNPFVPISAKKQEVLVLREGFSGFQSLYRNDPALVEKFDDAVWGGYSQ